MKKIVLSVLIAGSLLATSCKEVKKGATDLKDATVETAGKAADATTDAAGAVADGAKDAAGAVVDKASEMVSSALEGVSIPAFANEAVTKNLTDYAAYAKDYIAANGNLGKISALAPKGAALLAKGKELASKLDAKDLAKYKSVLSAIQAKMAPSK
ncbi:hypothetical protein [Polaribacter sp. Hel1_85]|uniref:hypothetical protein n=1 Tax=Polaribacter sp. Hel1_85 TaxID=1250005 RepID=UPI00052DE5F3|nr:hypothetical protein [Polaribacter sp. Hel1_85]KGL61877.1 hypothetical protein PHEL85_1662 [Polaribacter sp. Hel1_85]